MKEESIVVNEINNQYNKPAKTGHASLAWFKRQEKVYFLLY